jgi:hydrogenase/urease accessory protein HupE
MLSTNPVRPELVEGPLFLSAPCRGKTLPFDKLRANGLRGLNWTLAILALALLPGLAQAHDARPLSVTLIERPGAIYFARLAVPPSVSYDNQPAIVWPTTCQPVQIPDTGEMPVGAERQLEHCPGGLEGGRLGVRYAIYNPSLATLFRLEGADGQVLTQLLPPERLDWTIPTKPTPFAVAADYVRLGVAHIWTGVDHLLFVAGLLLLAGSLRRVLLAVTGFTIAHSITLALSALDLVRLPSPPVEAAIALSILFVAREVARPQPDSLAAQRPILVASSFGLLHGFGFATALREVGLPSGELATALLSFNLGVELGQLGFIAAVLALLWLVHRVRRESLRIDFALAGRPRVYAGYVLGVPAAFWFVQRMIPVFA